MRDLSIGLLAALAIVTGAAASERVPADSAATRQKAAFVENLVTESVSARRIENSGDAAAIDALERARELVERAQSDLAARNTAAADAKLGEALSLVNSEVRRISGGEVRDAHDRRMYERRLNAVETFLAAYERVAESGTGRAASQAREIRARLEAARERAAAGDYAAATAILDEAYADARADIREMREGQTLTRTLNFDTAEEAYEYEIGRNASYFELLRFAIAEKRPAGSMLAGIERNRDKAEALRSRAERAARAGRHAEAVETLNDSTQLLRRAIRMSGLFIPG